MGGTAMIRVLYVDDEPDLLEIGKVYLEEAGDFVITTADSAHAGLALLKKEQFDAVISDYQMPVMDGIELLKHIRGDAIDIPFIIFTGRGREEIVIEALNCGADFYLQKGGDPVAQFAELRHKILSAIGSHRADRSIREKTEELDRFFENALDLLCIADANGNLRRLSRQWETMLGFSRSEMEGKPFFSFVHPDDLASTRAAVEKLSAGEPAINFVNRFRCSNGSYRTIEWRSYPVGDLLYSAALDVTERIEAEDEAKRAHEELEASYEELTATSDSLRNALDTLAEKEMLYRTLFHEMLNGFAVHEIICDENDTPCDYRFLEVNEAFEQMTGLRSDDLIGKTVLEVMPETESSWIERYGRVALTGLPEHFDNYSQVLDKYYEVTAYRNAPGQFTTILADVTVTRRAELAVQDSERKYRNLYQYAQVGLFETSLKDGTVIACNERYVALAGFSSVNDAIGKDIVHLYANADDRKEMSRTLHEQGYIDDHVVLFRNHSTGQPFWAQFSARIDVEKDIAEGTIIDITELKRAEVNAHAHFLFLQTLIETIPNPVFYKDRAGAYTGCNSAFEKYLGLPRSEILGKTVFDLAPKEIAEEYLLRDKELFEKPGMQQYEYEVHTRSGDIRTVIFDKASLADSRGVVTGLIGVITDITERKQMEEALHKSEERVRSYIDTAPYGVFIADETGRYLEVNPAACRISGFTEKELLGMHIADLLSPESVQAGVRHFTEVAETGNARGDLAFRHKDGSVRIWSVDAVRLSPTRFLGFVQDVSDRKQAEAAHKESEERFRCVFDTLPLGLWVADKNGTLLMGNAAGQKIWEAHPQVGQDEYGVFTAWRLPSREPVRPDDWALFHAVNEGRVTEKELLEIEAFDGSHKYILNWAAPLRNEHGEIIGAFVINQDITKTRLADEAVALSESRYRQLTQTLQEILDSISATICVLDRQGIITMVNASWWRFARENGNPGPDKIGPGVNQLDVCKAAGAEDPSAAAAYDGISMVLEGTIPEFSFEYPCDSPVQKRWFLLKVSPITGPGGGAVLVHFDITGRKQVEEELRTSEEHYRQLIEHANEAIIVAQDGLLKMVNPMMATLTGYSIEELRSIPYNEIIHPDDRAIVAERHQQRISGETPASRYLFRIISKDSITRWVEISAVTISWEGYPATLNFLADITTRKQTEDALQESEVKYRELVESIHDVIYETDMKGVLTYISPVIRDILEYEPSEVIGKNFIGFVHPDDQDLLRSRFMDIFSLKGQSVDYRIMSKTGSIRWVRTHSIPVIRNGIYIGVRGALVDISDRKIAEAALKESEEFNRGLVENIPDMVVVYGTDRKVQYVNPAVFHLFGYTPEELEGTDMISYVVPEQRAEIAQIIQKRLVSGSTDSVEVEILTKDGTRLTVITRGTFIRYHQDLAVLLLLTNITDRKNLENQLVMRAEELAHLSSSLEQTNRKLGLMSAITRHDLTNQISGMMGYLALAKKRTEPEPIKEMIDNAMQGGRRVAEMIAFTKEYEEIGLKNPVWQRLDAIISAAEQLHPVTGIQIETDTGRFEIFSDPMADKVISNLFDNTVRHGEHATRIRITAHETPEALCITYQDDGIGVPPDEKEKIFDRDFGKHTGLGLFLVREILSITGITIKETGEPGKGARFAMRVPNGVWRNGGKNE
jgi:PAS domain S-box-containing protein